jgi:hypothetical protein
MSASFWHIDIGNVATWVGVVFVTVGFIRRFSRRIDLMEDSLKSSSRTLEKLGTLVDDMNRTGTSWSREKLASETLLQQDHSRRLNELESAFRDQSPKIAALVADVSWIKHHFQKNGQ